MKKNGQGLLVLVLVMLLFLSGCKQEEEKPDPLENGTLKLSDYYPIRENTLYIYQGQGNEYAAYSRFTDYIFGNEVQYRQENPGTTLAEVLELSGGVLKRTYLRGEAYYREDYLRNPNLRQVENNQPDTLEFILLKEPLKVGTNWDIGQGVTRSITGLDVEVTVPLGTFKAIEVSHSYNNGSGGKDRVTDYYVKDIGLVKTVFKTGEDEISSSLEKIETNTTYRRPVDFYYPQLDPGTFLQKTIEVPFRTNDPTKQVLGEAYRAGFTAEVKNAGAGQVLTPGTKVNALYLNQWDVAYLDLSGEFIREMNAGSGYESMLLQALAKTFGGYYGVPKLRLTIDNNNYSSGHIIMENGETLKVQ